MSTFSAFTCTLPLSALEPWEQRYYLARRNGRLAGFGDAAGNSPQPTRDEIECWAAAASEYNKGTALYANQDFIEELTGTPRMIWLGTFVCPKPDPWGRHQLYDAYVYYQIGYGQNPASQPNIRVEGPGNVCLFPAGQQYSKVPILKGMGYFDGAPGEKTEYGRAGEQWDGDSFTIFQAESRGYDLIRGHTAHGVAHKSIGAGSVLYAAMGIAAKVAGYEGVYSIEGTRSNEASALWVSAREPRTGPLAKRFKAAIEMGNPQARVKIGYPAHCLDENLTITKNTSYKNGLACPVKNVGCSTKEETLRIGTVGVDYVTPDGVKRWGLMAFDGRKRVVDSPLPKWGASDVTKAFGAAKGAKTAARDSASTLSDVGVEMLARSAVGASPHLVTKLAQVIYTRSPDLAHAFLTREDIVAVLSATAAGRKLVTDAGNGGALAGMGRTFLRDVEAAMYRPTSPTTLTLPPMSRAARSFVNSYPED